MYFQERTTRTVSLEKAVATVVQIPADDGSLRGSGTDGMTPMTTRMRDARAGKFLFGVSAFHTKAQPVCVSNHILCQKQFESCLLDASC